VAAHHRPLAQAFGRNPAFPAAPTSVLAPLDVGATVRRLHREAYAPGFHVPERLVDDIVGFVRADGRRRLEDPHHECPAVHRLAHDPALAEVARG
jgi:hypothetical protein